jgi:hypothetical protein
LITYFVTLSYQAGIRYVRPYHLQETLTTCLTTFRESHQAGIRRADLPADRQDALLIWLDYLLKPRLPDLVQEDINEACRHFLETYPRSPLVNIVKIAIEEWESGKWGIYLSLSYAAVSVHGNLDNYVRSSTGPNFEMGFLYRDWFLAAGFTPSYGRLQRDRTYDGNQTWASGSKYILARSGFRVGRAVFRREPHALIPFASLGTRRLGPYGVKPDDDLNRASINCFEYGIGLQYNLRLGKRMTLPPGNWREYGLHLRYMLLHATASPHQLNGTTHILSLGLAVSWRTLQRKR